LGADETDAVEALLEQALAHFHAGELEQSRAFCERTLAMEPEHAETLLLLGSITLRKGHIPEAQDLFLRAADAGPDTLVGNLAMGLTLRQSGRLSDAAVSFRRATELEPNDPSPWVLLRDTLATLNRQVEARECDRQLKRIQAASAPQLTRTPPRRKLRATQSPSVPQPSVPQPSILQPSILQPSILQPSIPKPPTLQELLRSGSALVTQGRIQEAAAAFQQAVARQPDSAPALHGLGYTLMCLERFQEAIPYFQRAVAIQPSLTDSYHNLAQGFIQLKRYEEAEDCARRQIHAEPNAPRAHQNLGSALFQQRRMAEAEACFRTVLTLNPQDADAHNSLGMMAAHAGRFEETFAYYQRALELRPDFPFAQANLGLMQLLHGDYERGWINYEQRLLLPGISLSLLVRRHKYWDGSPLAGKTILILAEQGMGDSIHFARYLPLLKAQGARIKFIGPRALKSLFMSLNDCAENGIKVNGIDENHIDANCIDEWYDMEAEVRVAGVDTYSALMSLPGLLGTRLETIPTHVPYLLPGAERQQHWQERLSAYSGYRVGIVWAGNPDFVNDRERSCRLSQFLPLFDIPGVTLFSLQKGDYATVQIGDLSPDRRLIDLSDELETLDDTAAAILTLDLVISVDTSVAHLAGALGRPVWTVLPYSPDWRWLLDRQDTPWYPTMRLFRQLAAGDWDAVFLAVSAALQGQTD
jgi:tetratricopeptide (TPR) repeat protein